MPKQVEPSHPLDQLYYRKPLRVHVREFALLWAAIVFGYCAFKIYNGTATETLLLTCLFVGTALIALGYFMPAVLLPFWRAWMKLAEILNVVVTFVILASVWTLLFIPIALLLKLMSIKVMDTSFDRSRESYWEDRKDKLHDFKLLERQF
ncbi:MAG: hypothetical protein D6719_12955 [Candidatus Dadabacteria bacterium]|nr:MAG: hypothetical protein D6719_12955 [Candidatus Dadabacteria bacterium]